MSVFVFLGGLLERLQLVLQLLHFRKDLVRDNGLRGSSDTEKEVRELNCRKRQSVVLFLELARLSCDEFLDRRQFT